MIQEGKANIVVGGQWGSEGKGKLYGYLYTQYPEINVAVCDFTPNAGHTYVDNAGRAYVSKILPIGTLFQSVEKVIIGPHAVIEKERFQQELTDFTNLNSNVKIMIHPLAAVLTPNNIADEARTLNSISSTMQGSASAQIAKIRRNPDLCSMVKDDPYFKEFVADTEMVMQVLLEAGNTVLIETAQGFDLGLNYGHTWPYVTGRDCSIGRWLDNAGVHPNQLGDIIVALRTYPIRVGNTEGGWSGPCWHDQKETSWKEISKKTGIETIEYTTVTKRVRRVFTWSDEQVRRMCMLIKPTYAFLNYTNYLECVKGDNNDFIPHVKELLGEYDCELVLSGWGARNDQMTVL